MRIFCCIIMMLVFVVTSDSFQSVLPLKQVIIILIMDFSVGTFFMYNIIRGNTTEYNDLLGFSINIFIHLTFFRKIGVVHLFYFSQNSDLLDLLLPLLSLQILNEKNLYFSFLQNLRPPSPLKGERNK